MTSNQSSYPLVTIQHYREMLLSALPTPEALEVGSFDAAGLVLAAEVHAVSPVPAVNVAGHAGIAIKAHDTNGASLTHPVVFTLRHGDDISTESSHPLAYWVSGGMTLPYGYDAIVPVSAQTAAQPRIVLTRAVPAGAHVATVGSDIAPQQLLAIPGHIVTPADVALFAAAGVDRVFCVPSPRIVVVGVAADHTRMTDPGVVGATRPVAMMLAALVRELGAMVFLGEEAFPSREALAHALDANLGRADLIILVGGTREATAPRVAAVLASLGSAVAATVTVDGLETQLFGTIGTCPVLAASGLPGVAHREFELVIRPVVRFLQGRRDTKRAVLTARLATPVAAHLNHDRYVPVRLRRVDGEWQCEPLADAPDVSHVTVAHTDGYLVIPTGECGYDAGAQVEVMLTAE